MDRQELIQWLLESSIPSIRYLTRRDLLRAESAGSEVEVDRRAITNTGPVPAILGKQAPTGGWTGERSFYTPKFTSTHWSMLLLTELDIDRCDERLHRGAIFMLDQIVLNQTWFALQRYVEQGQHGMECFWGNVLRYCLHAGLLDDPRIPQLVQLLADNAPRAGWRCEHNYEWPCAWGAARALWGLATLPEHMQTSDVKAAIQAGISYLLEENSLVAADYPTPENVRRHIIWSRLNFPLFYQADILFVLRVLRELDMLDHPGAEPALEWLQKRRAKDGRWRGASPFRQRTYPELGDRIETDRWVSLQAAQVLSRAQLDRDWAVI